MVHDWSQEPQKLFTFLKLTGLICKFNGGPRWSACELERCGKKRCYKSPQESGAAFSCARARGPPPLLYSHYHPSASAYGPLTVIIHGLHILIISTTSLSDFHS